MRLIHIVPRIISEASGPAYSVLALCRALEDAGHEPMLAVLEPAPEKILPEYVRFFPASGAPYRLGRSRDLRRWLDQLVGSGEIELVHNHSLWMMPNVYPGWVTRASQVPLVVSPRGTLSKWALNRSKWSKEVFWRLVQKPAICHAACFHATSQGEYEDIRSAGFKQPVCIIPNGIDIPRKPLHCKKLDSPRRLLFLGRLHPVKGIANLLRAWSAVEDRFKDWELDIVGPDNDGHLKEMQTLKNELDLTKVRFRGPLFGAEKLQAYQDAQLYVLPTHSENFGMTVAEALAAGTPAIVAKGAPWSGLKGHGAGWWVEIGTDPLVACLEEALSCSPEELATKGAAGRRWMQQEFSWERTAGMMSETYRWLRNGGSVPEWVRTGT